MINRWSYVSTLEAMSRYHTVYQSNYSPFSRTVFCSETSSSGLSLGRVGVNKLRCKNVLPYLTMATYYTHFWYSWGFKGLHPCMMVWACLHTNLAKRKYVWYTVHIVTMPTIPPKVWSWQLIAESEPLRILSQNRERSGSIDYSARTI